MKVKDRSIKVEEHYAERAYKEIVTSRIRLKGLWLESAGFTPGNRVTVTQIDNGKLLISLEE
jgi:hypothetical protein